MDWEENIDLPDDVKDLVDEEMSKLVPIKSARTYEKEYRAFLKWKKSKMVNGVTNEKMLIAYFGEKSRSVKPSSLWSYFSMIKKTLLVHENIDISRYVYRIEGDLRFHIAFCGINLQIWNSYVYFEK